MAEKNTDGKKPEKTPEELAQEKAKAREDARIFQSLVMNDIALKIFATANYAQDEKKYGEFGKRATYDLFINFPVGRDASFIGPVAQAAFAEAEKKRNPDSNTAETSSMYAGSVPTTDLIRRADKFRREGLNSMYVGDVLAYVGTSAEVAEKIPENVKAMTLGEYKESNPKEYAALVKNFSAYDEHNSVAGALFYFSQKSARGLEALLVPKEEAKPK